MFDFTDKSAVEDMDLVRLFANDARKILNKLDYDWQDDWPGTVRLLESHGFTGWPHARTVLEFIDWEDSRAE